MKTTGMDSVGGFDDPRGGAREVEVDRGGVGQIRMLHVQGWSYVRLGKMFGVSDDAVRDSVRGRTWKDI
jgi:hypothetical protein